MRLRALPLGGGGRSTAPGGGARSAGPWDALAALALLLATAALYHDVTGLWWIADDFFNVRWVHWWAPAQYSLDPEVWQQLPFSMLTPLLFASYDLDLSLFGPEPFGFYVHQLLALGLAAVAFYALLRRWLAPGWSLFGAWLFLTGPPVLSLAPLVMVRHYIECVLLALLAVLAWVAALRAPHRQRATAWALLSALLWLAAAAAKEIAVPLVLVLPLVPEGDFARRLRLSWPHALALLVYLLYRWFLLGVLGGGYGWVATGGERLQLAAALPLRIGQQLLGTPSPAAWLALACVLVGTVLAAARSRRAALLVGAGLVLAVLPVLPVATEVVSRYAVAAWVVLALACPVGLRSVRGGAAVAALAAVALLVANRDGWGDEMASRERMSAEYRALLDLAAGDVLRGPSGPPSSLVEVARFGSAVLGREAAAGWFVDDFYLCRPTEPIRRLWQYDAGQGRVVERTNQLAALREGHCGHLRQAAPLTARFERLEPDSSVMRWTLGPYSDGRWSFVFDHGVMAFEVPRTGAFHVGATGPGPLRVRYDSPEGWATYSRELRLREGPGAQLSWRRPRPLTAPPPSAPPRRERAPPARPDTAGRPGGRAAAPPATPPGG